jgi:hypothetical protein
MRHARISVVIATLFLCSLSCRETIGERHDSPQKENSTLPSQKKKIENPEKTKDRTTPFKKPQQEEIKKKKQKASDTLKPKMAELNSIPRKS